MKKYSILIVDDEEFNLQIILDILDQAKENYSVYIANNGKMACETALKIVPDVILMDWKMPKMTGIEAIKQLKSQQKTKDIPVINDHSGYFTGKTEGSIRSRCC